ncbi:hypothetical protein [Vibrio sp. 99K-1]|nr:hypothetical protein [Vibrio sp. 99K-1]
MHLRYFNAPAVGQKPTKELSGVMKLEMSIGEELGYNREEVTAVR